MILNFNLRVIVVQFWLPVQNCRDLRRNTFRGKVELKIEAILLVNLKVSVGSRCGG